ncbi:MAG TPA: PilZ domain-containing protein [Kofleriaceae bacterium]|nr:PilZ domain-containing protein [Kofleriaceae bacterium]
MTEDRRTAPREEAYLSAALETSQGSQTIAITHDISSKGLLLLTRVALALGEVVKLTVVIDGEQHVLSGAVVRVDVLESSELWHHKLALSVDGAEPVLARLHARLSERAEPAEPAEPK